VLLDEIVVNGMFDRGMFFEDDRLGRMLAGTRMPRVVAPVGKRNKELHAFTRNYQILAKHLPVLVVLQ
jgi:hypothetical protein